MLRQKSRISDAFAVFFFSLILAGLSGCVAKIGNDDAVSLPNTRNLLIISDTTRLANLDIILPASTLDLLACVTCHKGLKVNTQKRILGSSHLGFAFDHQGFESGNKWCYYCHYTEAFDKLIMESGKLITYPDSYQLCVQCHPLNYKEWELGVHGRRNGMWGGAKQYLSCIYCHNPHTPKFKPVEPMKPPLSPNNSGFMLN
jgi:hypothetical protein